MQCKIHKALSYLLFCFRSLTFDRVLLLGEVSDVRYRHDVGFSWFACVLLTDFEDVLNHLALFNDGQTIAHVVSRWFSITVKIIMRFFAFLTAQRFVRLIQIHSFFTLNSFFVRISDNFGPVCVPVDFFNCNFVSAIH